MSCDFFRGEKDILRRLQGDLIFLWANDAGEEKLTSFNSEPSFEFIWFPVLAFFFLPEEDFDASFFRMGVLFRAMH